MARSCQVCGKGFSVGNQVTIRGKAKYLGGVGLKTTSVKKRTFKPNLQTVETMENGTRKRVKASVRAIRAGLVVKPAKRAYTYTREKRAGA
ncbi:MAG: 50S ribosomal protein L28 [Phycisphaerales bacterium]